MNLDNNSEGILTHIGNELLNDSRVNDPSAYRGGSPETQRSLVKFSGDIILPNGTRQEIVLIQFKQTEHNNQLSGKGGELYIGLAKEDAGTTDDAMIDALVATVKDGFHFKLPIYAPNLNQSINHMSRFYSDDGKYCFNVQGDEGGHIVQYDTHGSTDESTWTPVGQFRAT